MKITNHELASLIHGAAYFDETADGYLYPMHYCKEQTEYFRITNTFWYERCLATNGKTIEFITDGDFFAFDYRLVWIGSEDTVELWIDNTCHKIVPLGELAKEGRISFDLPKGEKKVCIYLPVDATMLVRNAEITGNRSTVTKGEKILWLGDSITQGYGPLRSSMSYVCVASRILGCESINQGIGSYVFDVNGLGYIPGYTPDKIVVSMGTNQHQSPNQEPIIRQYFDKLSEMYPGIPVLCITPIWRDDMPENFHLLLDLRELIEKICAEYDNISVVDGFELVPHSPEYFIDKLHPNVPGCKLYGQNLTEAMRRLCFVD